MAYQCILTQNYMWNNPEIYDDNVQKYLVTTVRRLEACYVSESVVYWTGLEDSLYIRLNAAPKTHLFINK